MCLTWQGKFSQQIFRMHPINYGRDWIDLDLFSRRVNPGPMLHKRSSGIPLLVIASTIGEGDLHLVISGCLLVVARTNASRRTAPTPPSLLLRQMHAWASPRPPPVCTTPPPDTCTPLQGAGANRGYSNETDLCSMREIYIGRFSLFPSGQAIKRLDQLNLPLDNFWK